MPADITDLTGKVCIVTGSTSGIGLVTARELARMKATVIMVSLDPEECSRVGEEIRQATGNTQVYPFAADLSSQNEIKRVTAEIKNRIQRLDVLINNAGAVFMNRRLSVDGIEMTLALNHLSYFLFTHLLLDLLAASAPARVVNVTSAIHNQARLNFDDLQSSRGYTGLEAYAQSKLANLLFSSELARRLEGSGVTVNAVHPGYVATNLGRNNAGFLKPLLSFLKIGGLTPEEGARPVLYLAASPELEKITGGYFDKDNLSSSLAVYDQQAAEQLWQVSLELTHLNELPDQTLKVSENL